MKYHGFFSFIFATVVSCASSSTLDQDRLHNLIPSDCVSANDTDVAKIMGRRPGLVSPFKLGIYLRDHRWRWLFGPEQRQTLMSLREQLIHDGLVSDVFFVLPNTLPQDSRNFDPVATLPNIRIAAARYGADAVLIIDGATYVDAYANPLSFFYITIIGLWLVPGSHRHAHYLARAALWDVRTEYLYFAVESYGSGSTMRPYIFIEDPPAIGLARHEALTSLVDVIHSSFSRLKGSR